MLIGLATGIVGVVAMLFARGIFHAVDEPFKEAVNLLLNLLPGIAAFAAALPARERPVANGLAAATLAVVIGLAAAVLMLGPVLLLVALPMLVALIPVAIEAYLGAIIGAWLGRRWRGAGAPPGATG
ncbi:MAG: hypothetical protein HS128_14755 [Ideonella sp.]|nr:hypothetical protein [Ideonella sp.]MCC7456148.1 hypothetical protein [Nitrospira sp.]